VLLTYVFVIHDTAL